MEGESNGMEGSQNRRQCQSGCGFFGSPATDGLCSLCYKEVVKKKQQPPSGSMSMNMKVPNPPRPAEPLSPSSISFLQQQAQKPIETPPSDDAKPSAIAEDSGDALAASHAIVATSPETPGSESKKKSNRCLNCRKKVGLTGFECRCGGLFCSTHRYSDKHNCSFDYRQLGAEEIRKNNPVVVSEKISKI